MTVTTPTRATARPRAALACVTVLLLGASACSSATPAPTQTAPGVAPATQVAASHPSPSPTPSPSPLNPSALPASVAASPGVPLAVLPDSRAGALLDKPLLVRGIPLINRNHPVSKAFAPKLVSGYQLVPEANTAFVAMLAAAKKAGVSIIWRVGYRSYAEQQQLSATPPANYGDDAAGYVAKPGQSEHQAGLAVDVASKAGYGSRFPQTKEFAWLRANSYRYGFVLRYPEGRTAITGMNYEPWHYRYIGTPAASAFGPNSTLTLEEYLGGR